MPNNWNDFLAVPANKADLADFLSIYLIINAPPGKILVVAGGFQREDQVWTSDNELDIHMLEARHEEADTRMILH